MALPSLRQTEIINQARVAHLATADAAAAPHVVPVCFIYDGSCIYSVIDQKPKRTGAMGLKRVRNIIANPQVALVLDDYDEDWSRLWYILIRGQAEVLQVGAERETAIKLLRGKYPQYRRMEIEDSPVIKIRPTKVIGWDHTQAD